MTNAATPYLPNTPQMYGPGGTSIYSPVSAGKKETIAYEFATALVRSNEIVYTAHGANS